MSHAKQSQILGLDLLRCAAAIMVMLYHYACFMPVWYWGFNKAPWEPGVSFQGLVPYTWFGWVGVQVFFVISGFVIAYSSNRATPTGFLKSRFLRLFPTLWVCSTITFVVRFFLDREPQGDLFRDWLHTIVLAPWTTRWIDSSYWTLPIEVSFYAIVFVLLASGTYRRLGAVVCCFGLLSTTVALYERAASTGLLQHMAFADKIVDSADRPLVLVLLIRNGLYFALGTELWLFLFERKSLARSLFIGFFVLGAIAEMRWHVEQFAMAMQDRHDYTYLPPALPAALWAVGIIAIIVSVLANGRITKALGPTGARFTRRLGLATYPIYLLHQGIGHVIIEHLHGHTSPMCGPFACSCWRSLPSASLCCLTSSNRCRRFFATGWASPSDKTRSQRQRFLDQFSL